MTKELGVVFSGFESLSYGMHEERAVRERDQRGAGTGVGNTAAMVQKGHVSGG